MTIMVQFIIMDRQQFNEILEQVELTKEEFAQKVGLKYLSVNNWGSTQNIPKWVDSWMELYVENYKCRKLREAIKQLENSVG